MEGSDVEALVPSRSLDISLPDQSHQPPSIQKASLPVLPSDNGGLANNLTPTIEEVKEDIVEGSSLPRGMEIDVREISENAIRNKTDFVLGTDFFGFGIKYYSEVWLKSQGIGLI
ncbi:hypothetical protein CK203_117790 [Vitis vinifera]|nr:hypothetical protein CK203_117790 [Vitis vinifera]